MKKKKGGIRIAAKTYEEVGVRYSSIDRFKIAAQRAASETKDNSSWLGCVGDEKSRGESAYKMKMLGGTFSGFSGVLEGIGTKSNIAKEMQNLTGELFFGNIAIDNFATIVNDLIQSGEFPAKTCLILATGSSDWFDDEKRFENLIEGWKESCDYAECAWGGGETQVLKGIIVPGELFLAGSAVGLSPFPECQISSESIQVGDRIMMFESSGIHTNGLTWARDIAQGLEKGYLTELPNGKTYGETLLDPSIIYVQLIKECLREGVHIHYAVHMTGHGWLKLMRPERNLSYVIEKLPTSLPIFEFIQKAENISDIEMFRTFNMGGGFAIYVPPEWVEKVEAIAKELRYSVFNVGYIRESMEKELIIKPKNLYFSGDELKIRV